MMLASSCGLTFPPQPLTTAAASAALRRPCFCSRNFSFPFWTHPFGEIATRPLSVLAKKEQRGESQQPEPFLKPTIIKEVAVDEDDEEAQQLLFDEFEDDEALMEGDEDDFEDEYSEDDESELYVGDGGAGGGIAFAGTWWDKEALRIAEDVCLSFDGELKIYAFKTLMNSTIQVRIERLTNKSGSPSMEDIEAFSTTYRARLDEAELAKTIPDNLALEVSSPGVERVVRVPEELDRFKDRPMYVKYVDEVAALDSNQQSDGVFKLISFDMETKYSTWALADVRINREKAGKGRPLSKKQREWRLNTPFDSLRLNAAETRLLFFQSNGTKIPLARYLPTWRGNVIDGNELVSCPWHVTVC